MRIMSPFSWAGVGAIVVGIIQHNVFVISGGAVFAIALCQPMVNLVLAGLTMAIIRHHESVPTLHGKHLATVCPLCEAVHAKTTA